MLATIALAAVLAAPPADYAAARSAAVGYVWRDVAGYGPCLVHPDTKSGDLCPHHHPDGRVVYRPVVFVTAPAPAVFAPAACPGGVCPIHR